LAPQKSSVPASAYLSDKVVGWLKRQIIGDHVLEAKDSPEGTFNYPKKDLTDNSGE